VTPLTLADVSDALRRSPARDWSDADLVALLDDLRWAGLAVAPADALYGDVSAQTAEIVGWQLGRITKALAAGTTDDIADAVQVIAEEMGL